MPTISEVTFSTKELARALGVHAGTVNNWSYAGTGPARSWSEGHAFYIESAVRSWIASSPDRRGRYGVSLDKYLNRAGS